MKMLDRIIFIVIAVALCVLCMRSFQVIPQVEAAREEIIKVNLVEISGQRIFRSDIIGK